jgi:site-specific recombinase XerC
MSDEVTVPGRQNQPALPPVIAGANTPEIERRVENFFHSVASIFEAWVNRRKSEHTRRAYRGDVMAFVQFRGWAWPGDAAQLLRVSIFDVQAFKEHMVKHGAAPKTINRRISSLVIVLQVSSWCGRRAAAAHHRAQPRSRAIHRA